VKDYHISKIGVKKQYRMNGNAENVASPSKVFLAKSIRFGQKWSDLGKFDYICAKSKSYILKSIRSPTAMYK